MAADEMTWRKLPRNIITDPTMDYIASRLPPEYASAPYMFYIVAMSLADDDGIFDLEDGIIFSRLMHVQDPSIVAKTANLMLERKIIVRAGHTTKCMITEWGYSSKTPGRTLEQRRQVVQRKMEQERQTRSEQFTKLDQAAAEAETVISLSFNTSPLADDFLCPNDDKNAENVVKKNETEKIREDKTRLDLEKNTHREDKNRETEKQQLQAPADQPYAAAEEEIAAELEQQEVIDETEITPTDLAEQAFKAARENHEEEKTRLLPILNQFFTKNCLGYKAELFQTELNIIMDRIIELSDDKNPANIVAATLLGQFKKLTEDEGYYHNHPLRPTSLLKQGIWEHTLQATSKILLSGAASKPAWVKQLEEAAAQKELVGDALNRMYLEYNIDPQDPHRAELLLQAQRNEKARSSSP